MSAADMENLFTGNLYPETSSDEFPSDSSDYDSDGPHDKQHNIKCHQSNRTTDTIISPKENLNLLDKVFNRERTGHFSGNSLCRQSHRAFNKVPTRLGFCLKDIVPYCYLQGHMFMGLSACGQFLLSYKVCINDSAATNDYYFNIGYKYTLYLWIYRPHQPLRRFFKSCLFDDHGVDNLKSVKIIQWKKSHQVLIVHGAAENENEDSYITYVKVPKISCLDCKNLRDEDGFYRSDALCLKCNLTVHTKYSTSESDPKFNPKVNLICPERIIIVASGFIHMLHIDLEAAPTSNYQMNVGIMSPQQQQQIGLLPQNHNSVANTVSYRSISAHEPSTLLAERRQTLHHQQQQQQQQRTISVSRVAPPEETLGCDNKNNIVARIIADFSDIETDIVHPGGSNRVLEKCIQRGNESNVNRKNYDELIFTCSGISSETAASDVENNQQSKNSIAAVSSKSPTKVSLVNHQGKRNHRIVTKSYRNGITTVDMHVGVATSSACTKPVTDSDKSNAYEFSEDNEKCEKIGTFRKRRLADKKYEFSEDNLENIVPFTKVRSASVSHNLRSTPATSSAAIGAATSRLPRTTSHFYHSPCVSPSSSPHSSHSAIMFSNANDTSHRSSPIQGFRSPSCGSPVGAGAIGGIMRSPGKHNTAQFYNQKSPPHLSQATQHMLSFKPLTTLSPLQVSVTKRNHYEIGGNMSPTSVPFLSPRREEQKVIEVPLQGGFGPEKPVCTKKFKRRYVEEDDAASVITSEEDDCISPGYHTSLPVEVHGACYSDMQMVSQATYQRLRCVSVVITQHSFDLETFTYYVISNLCQKNNKTYDVFYDWACEIINVCPRSHLISCILMAQFTAHDQLPVATKNCLNCSRNIDCAFHRKQFECRILFTWNMETGDWNVIDYGELHESNSSSSTRNSARNGSTSGKKSSGDSLTYTAKFLAHELADSLYKLEDFTDSLRILDSNVSKSKTCLTDLDNSIEFYLKRQKCNE